MAKKTTNTAAAPVTKPQPKHRPKITTGLDRTHKICSICKKPQPLDMFYRPEKDCRCKECGKTYAKHLRERKNAEAEAAVAAAPQKTVKKAAK